MFLITGNFALSNQMNDNEINNKQQEANRAYENIVRRSGVGSGRM